MFAVRPVQYKEKPITAGLRQEFSTLSFELRVEQDRRLHGIPVVRVVWRHLVTHAIFPVFTSTATSNKSTNCRPCARHLRVPGWDSPYPSK